MTLLLLLLTLLAALFPPPVVAAPGNCVAGGSGYGVSFSWNRPDTISLLGDGLPTDDMTVEYWYRNTNINADYQTLHAYSAYNVQGYLGAGGEPYEGK